MKLLFYGFLNYGFRQLLLNPEKGVSKRFVLILGAESHMALVGL